MSVASVNGSQQNIIAHAQRKAVDEPVVDERAIDDSGVDRSPVARWAALSSMAGGAAANVIDVVRLVKKFPEALRAGQFVPELGKFGRIDSAIGQTLLMAPNKHIIDPLAPRVPTVASLGKSFTRADEILMKTGVGISSAVAGIQFASAIPNLIDAAKQDGSLRENLVGTQSGRTGILQATGGGIGLGMLATGLVQSHRLGITTAADGITGSLFSRGLQRVLDAGKAPVMANPMLKYIGIASGLAVMGNELGYFDALNKDNTEPVSKTLQNAAQKTPILNGKKTRSIAFGGGAAIAGWKLTQAATMPGGLLANARVPAAGLLIAGGLLGANLLGVFDGINR